MHFLPDVLRLLAPGGLLVSDNVLQEGNIIESRYAVCRRDRTIHARMREYLYTLTHHDELETVVLPVGDGATLSVKLPRKKSRTRSREMENEESKSDEKTGIADSGRQF